MTPGHARLLVMVGAVGLPTLGTLAGASLVRRPTVLDLSPRLARCAPRDPRGTVEKVALADGGGMMGPGSTLTVSVDASAHSVAAGTVAFVATKVGALNHELVNLPAPAHGTGTRAVGAKGRSVR